MQGWCVRLFADRRCLYEQLHYRNQTSYKTVWHPKECCRSEYPCGKRKDLRSAGKKRSRKDNDHENAAWPDAAHFRRGKNLGETFAGERKEIASSLIESPGFYPNLTATENLRIFATLRGVPNRHAIKDALDLVGLPYKDKKLFSQYSLGMKQRLAIALAVMHDPELLILDEPINGLDPIGIAEVRSFIRELCDARGKTILISSHILSEISLLADDVGIIDHGTLLEEESLAELEQKSSKHIHFTVSNTSQAARVLERDFQENHFSVLDDHNIQLYNLTLPIGKIVTAFVANGLEVSEAHSCEESLEDYFKRVTGGEGIA